MIDRPTLITPALSYILDRWPKARAIGWDIYFHPGTGFRRSFLAAVSPSGRVLMWDDRIDAWITCWNINSWGSGMVIQYCSDEWFKERMSR